MALQTPPVGTLLGSSTYPHRLYHGGLSEVRYVHPSGDDLNDGLKWGTAKETILGAYDVLPTTGGTIYIADSSHVGGETAGQGIWLASTLDPNYASMSYDSGTYPGWRKYKPVVFIGNVKAGNESGDRARVNPGQPGDTTWSGPWIWVTGELGPLTFRNLLVHVHSGPWGIDHSRFSDGNTMNYGGTGANGVVFDHVTSNCTNAHGLAGYNPLRVGASPNWNEGVSDGMAPFWWTIKDCMFNLGEGEPTTTITAPVSASTQMASETWTLASASPTGFPVADLPFVIQCGTEQVLVTAIAGTSWTVTRGYRGTGAFAHADDSSVIFDPEDERRAAVLFHGYLLDIYNVIPTFGGIHVSGQSIRIHSISLESCSGPAVKVTNGEGVTLDGIELYDQPSGALPRGVVVVEPTTAEPQNVDIRGHGANSSGNAGFVAGPAIVRKSALGAASQTPPGRIYADNTSLRWGNIGYVGRRVLGQVDAARRAFGPRMAFGTNLVNQTGATWTAIGDGSATVTTAQPGPDGSSNAVALDGNDTTYRGIYSGTWNPAVPSNEYGSVGDFLVWGAWVYGYWPRFAYDSSVHDLFRVTRTAGSLTFAQGPFVEEEGATDFEQPGPEQPFYYGRHWQWLSGYAKVRVGGSSTLKFRVYGLISICYPVLFTLAGYSESDVAEIAQHLPTWPDTVPAGAVTTDRGQKFIAWDGLGVGNSASATSLGSMVKKLEVYDETGASLGFVPVYEDTPFDPSTVTGLAAWYDFSDASTLFTDTGRTTAVSADGNVIKGVTDLSSAANHLSEATNGPTYKVAIQNGLSIARFDDSNDTLTRGSLTASTTTPHTIFLVFIPSGAGVILTYGGNLKQNSSPAGNMQAQGGSADTIINNQSGINVEVWKIDGASSKAWGHTGNVDTGNAGSTTATTVLLSNIGDPWGGDIGEVIIYDASLSLDDINSVAEYLADKWGTSWATAT